MGGSSGSSKTTQELKLPDFISDFVPPALQAFQNQLTTGSSAKAPTASTPARRTIQPVPSATGGLNINMFGEPIGSTSGGGFAGRGLWPVTAPVVGAPTTARSGLPLSGLPGFFPGPTVAGLTPNQLAGIGVAGGAGRQALPIAAAQTGSGLSQDAALRYMLSGAPLDVGSNPYVAGAVKAATDPITQALTEAVLPQIRDDFIGGGGRGSSREALATGRAVEGSQRAIGQTASNILNSAYGQGLENFTRTLGLSPSIIQSRTLPIETLSRGADLFSRAGAQEQGQTQAELNAARERFEFEENAPLDALERYVRLLGALVPGTSSQTTVKGGDTSPFNAALGGALPGFIAGATVPGLGIGPGLGAGLGAGAGLLGSLF